MKKKSKHNTWLVNFTSCVAGTILGIALTFGISHYLSEKESKELFIKTVDFSLSNIKRYVEEIDDKAKVVAHRDSLFQALNKYYPLRASEANTDTINMCVNELFTFNFLGMDNTAHSIFASSIETWRNSDNLKLTEDLGDCFAMIDLYNNENKQINELREDLIEEFLNNNEHYRGYSPREKAEAFFKTKGFEFYMQKHKIYSQVIEYLHSNMQTSYSLADSSLRTELAEH